MQTSLFQTRVNRHAAEPDHSRSYRTRHQTGIFETRQKHCGPTPIVSVGPQLAPQLRIECPMSNVKPGSAGRSG